MGSRNKEHSILETVCSFLCWMIPSYLLNAIGWMMAFTDGFEKISNGLIAIAMGYKVIVYLAWIVFQITSTIKRNESAGLKILTLLGYFVFIPLADSFLQAFTFNLSFCLVVSSILLGWKIHLKAKVEKSEMSKEISFKENVNYRKKWRWPKPTKAFTFRNCLLWMNYLSMLSFWPVFIISWLYVTFTGMDDSAAAALGFLPIVTIPVLAVVFILIYWWLLWNSETKNRVLLTLLPLFGFQFLFIVMTLLGMVGFPFVLIKEGTYLEEVD